MSAPLHIGLSNKNTEGITITVEKLSKRFNKEWIFRNFSFSFTGGNIYAVTGPNGSGKSTLLQVLWGQTPPTSGSFQYIINGKEIEIENIYEHLSIATPYLDLIEEFTLEEQLSFHFKLRQIREGVSVQELLDIMYLRPAREKYLGNFSSGMRQRVKLALAFYTKATVYFLDEPSTNLDGEAFAWYKKELEKLPPGSLIFIASNNPAEYPHTATPINIMNFKTL